MEKKLNKALDELILTIKESTDYKKCLELKERLKKSNDVLELVSEIKETQKEYVKSNDVGILEKLNDMTKKLEEIPLYNTYMYHLERVNLMIDTVKDELAEYFNDLLNEEML